MPKIEVDEEEFVRNSKLRDTVAKIWADPKRRVKLQELHKEADPSAQTPELDTLAPVNEAISGIRKDVSEFLAAQRKEREEREARERGEAITAQVASGLSKLKAAGWTDEGIKGVQEIMEKHAILDPEIAASHYEKLHPPQALATPTAGGAWNFMEPPPDDQADLKKLIETKGESVPLLDKIIHNTLAESRGAASVRR